MTLHSDWRYLLRRSWSVRWQAIGALLDGAQLALPLFSDRFSPTPFAGLIMLVCLGGIAARVMQQPKDGL
jgi:hypothetical protein